MPCAALAGKCAALAGRSAWMRNESAAHGFLFGQQPCRRHGLGAGQEVEPQRLAWSNNGVGLASPSDEYLTYLFLTEGNTVSWHLWASFLRRLPIAHGSGGHLNGFAGLAAATCFSTPSSGGQLSDPGEHLLAAESCHCFGRWLLCSSDL